MADQLISRRSIVPGLALGAAAALAPGQVEAAQAREKARQSSCLSNTKLFRGRSMVFQVFLPQGPRVSTKPTDLRLTLQTLDGVLVVQHDFQLLPGRGAEFTLESLQDGSALFNGIPVVGDWDADGRGDAIIGILTGLLLPAVLDPEMAVLSYSPGTAGGRPTVDYIFRCASTAGSTK